jgi:hypothetical protein
VVLIHGEDESRQALAKRIRRDHPMGTILPEMGETMTLQVLNQVEQGTATENMEIFLGGPFRG